MIIGAGKAKAYRYLDSRVRTPLGQFLEGQIIGEIQVLFDTLPTFTIETESYCNLATITFKKVKKFMETNQHVKQDMIDEIMWNPYDYERDEFIKLCRKNVPYFRYVHDDFLKKVYYHSKLEFINTS